MNTVSSELPKQCVTESKNRQQIARTTEKCDEKAFGHLIGASRMFVFSPVEYQ